MDKIRLKVLGLSTGQIRRNAYALVLGMVDGAVSIPIVIGEAEARAIAARMDNLTTPRPLTHDLFASFTQAFGIAMQEVFIHKFEDGIYYSDISFTDGERRVTFDARTSDAIAIAMRTGAPIFTTAEILHQCGFVLEQQAEPSSAPATPSYEDMELDQLEQLRNQAVEREDYEEAAKITEYINRKNI